MGVSSVVCDITASVCVWTDSGKLQRHSRQDGIAYEEDVGNEASGK